MLEKLLETGTANGVKGLEILTREQVKEIEPNVDVAAALYSPNTGVVDYAVVAQSFAKDVERSAGSKVQLSFEVNDIKLVKDEGGQNLVQVSGVEPGQKGPTKIVIAKSVITCCGLQSDQVAVKAGGERKPKVLPFRGTYYQMKPEYRNIVKRNIYPIPSNGGIPVGVHFTPTVNERRGKQMIVGPGACIAFGREAYSFWDINPAEVFRIVTNMAFWKFAWQNYDLAFTEMYRDLVKSAFLGEARKLVPTLKDEWVEESFCGVMAQVFEADGKAASDFIFERKVMDGTTLCVRNAPSPACTASMHIAFKVVQLAEKDFGWVNAEAKRQEAAALSESATI